jgi:hypothetical protein
MNGDNSEAPKNWSIIKLIRFHLLKYNMKGGKYGHKHHYFLRYYMRLKINQLPYPILGCYQRIFLSFSFLFLNPFQFIFVSIYTSLCMFHKDLLSVSIQCTYPSFFIHWLFICSMRPTDLSINVCWCYCECGLLILLASVFQEFELLIL